MNLPSGQAAIGFGVDRGCGNLLALQPELRPADYASAATLLTKVDHCLAAAASNGWLNPQTIAIFPEHIGTWLFATGAPARFHRARSLAQALPYLIWRQPRRFLKSWLLAWGHSRLQDAVWRMSAPAMAQQYQQIFATVAQRYGVTVVAGSIVLPGPRVVAGALQTTTGALYNVSALFGPDGALAPQLVRKQFPTREERLWLSPGLPLDLPVFATPAGQLGILICADSWYVTPYKKLVRQGAELLAVPAFLTGHDSWNQPWAGYNGGAPPADVDYHDIGSLTEGAAWCKYAMPGRLPGSGLRAGITVFSRGDLWGLGADGQTLAVREGHWYRSPQAAMLVNLWL
jgi:hypothetical protein